MLKTGSVSLLGSKKPKNQKIEGGKGKPKGKGQDDGDMEMEADIGMNNIHKGGDFDSPPVG